MTLIRIQLTLFLDPDTAAAIEKIRRKFNPEQYELIKSHVTLCREDELEPIETVIRNLEQLNQNPIPIDFGNPILFSDGKGVLLPAIGNNQQFQQARARILKGITEKPRTHEPHITLMHPRNSTCTDDIFAQIETHIFPNKIEFRKISLIEQESGKQWMVLKEYELKNSNEIQ